MLMLWLFIGSVSILWFLIGLQIYAETLNTYGPMNIRYIFDVFRYIGPLGLLMLLVCFLITLIWRK